MVHPSEDARLASLAACFILDTGPEPAYDDLTRLAAQTCDVPVAMLNLVDRDRVFIKSAWGIEPGREIPRHESFCSEAILGDAALAIQDASADPRFADSPLVTGPGGMRFYHGLPLVPADGLPLGTLCVMDQRARKLGPAVAGRLDALARVATALLVARRDLERARRVHVAEAEARVQLVLDATGHGIWDWDAASGRVYMSPHWRRLLGYGDGDDAGTIDDWLALIHPDDLATIAEDVMNHLHRFNASTHSAEYRVRAADGSYRWIRDRARVLRRAANGSPQRVVGSYSEVTEERRGREALRVARDSADAELGRRSAELESTLAELELFASTLSHDLRAPVRACAGYAGLLAESEPDLSPEGRDMLDKIRCKAAHIGAMVESMLDYLRAGRHAELVARRVDLAEIVRSTWSELTGGNPEQAATLTLHPLPECCADERLLRSVFENVLANALKYSGRQPHPRIEVAGEAEEGGCHVRVADNGIGFDATGAARLFLPFQRLAPEFPGVGLGLASVRRSVARLGGRVWAEGVPGAGATFHLWLPGAGAQPAATSAATPPDSADASAGAGAERR